MTNLAKKPTGRPGDWLALEHGEGKRLPCVWTTGQRGTGMQYPVKGGKPVYRDIFDEMDQQRLSYIDAIKQHKLVIVTSPKRELVDGHPSRDKYVALWSVDNVVFNDGVLTFDFVDRIRDYRN